MSTANDRLAEQLDAKDNEIAELEAKVERLERELEGSIEGWRRAVDMADDEALPLPRLEMVYEQIDGWRSYRVHYRIVLKHLLGEVYALPVSYTKCSGGMGKQPPPTDLPFRDGAHAAHDATFLGLPCYRIMPGEAPQRLSFSEYDHQRASGEKHRRAVSPQGERPR